MSSASTFNPTGGCAKGHYQLIAFCSLEQTGSHSLSFSVWAGVLGMAVPPERCSRSAGAPRGAQRADFK